MKKLSEEERVDFGRVAALSKSEQISSKEACVKIGRPVHFYDYVRRKIKAENEVGVKPKPKPGRKSKVPQLVTLSMPDRRKESITIMMGDPDEIARILDKAKQVKNG